MQGFKLTEDWIATLTGLFIVAVIGAGLLGPGPHRVTLEAEPGESVSAEADARDGWTVTATLDDESIAVADSGTLEDARDYLFVCAGGDLQVTTQDAGDTDDGQVTLTLQNDCDADLTLRYTIDAAIQWPLFGLFE